MTLFCSSMLECLTVSLSIDHRNAEEVAWRSSPSQTFCWSTSISSVTIYVAFTPTCNQSSQVRTCYSFQDSKSLGHLGHHMCSTGISTQQPDGKKWKMPLHVLYLNYLGGYWQIQKSREINKFRDKVIYILASKTKIHELCIWIKLSRLFDLVVAVLQY